MRHLRIVLMMSCSLPLPPFSARISRAPAQPIPRKRRRSEGDEAEEIGDALEGVSNVTKSVS
jgi:hypothetical protein